ncbi:Mal-a5p [Chamberlinius hualienensis]
MENQNYTGPSPTGSGDGDKGVKSDIKEVVGDEKHDLEDNKDNTLHREDNEEVNEKTKMAYSETDPTKIKFTNMVNHGAAFDGKTEAKVDIENVQLSFAGMGKEELMKYADDPFWIRLRWSLFILFWICWLAMLAGAIIIVVMTPGCPPPPIREWYHKGVVYQVYPATFKDTNNDGIGDLKGITEKLTYIKELGVNAIWLNPIFTSPFKDGGYDISDYTDIDPKFGNLTDFDELLRLAKEKELRVILDFVPNHTSEEHPWFKKSKKNESIYGDFYIWRTGQLPQQRPNNWLSVLGGPAWTYNTDMSSFYYHQFLPSQPDLNLRNPKVRDELQKILRFWLDRGVDGFRVDAVHHLFESEHLENESPSNAAISSIPEDSYGSLIHNYTTGQPESLELLREWREILDSYEAIDGKHRLLITESYGTQSSILEYYGNASVPLADFSFTFNLVDLTKNDGAQSVYRAVKSWYDATNSNDSMWPSWVLGNHDKPRVASRVGDELVDAYHVVTMLLKGTPVTYYGEEIGMPNGQVSYEQQKDPLGMSHSKTDYQQYSRDLARTPMQWSNEDQSGFTNSTLPWLPVGDSYTAINVMIQTGDFSSHLEIYKKLVKLRPEPAILYGDLYFLMNNKTDVLTFARVKKGSPGFVAVINFSRNDTVVDLPSINHNEKFKFPDYGTYELRSSPEYSDSYSSKSGSKDKVSLKALPLKGREAVVVKFVPNFE